MPSPLQGTSASTALNIKHSPYSGTFTFRARVVKSGNIQTGDYKTHGLVLSPGPISAFTWIKNVALNPETNQNSQVIFDFSFDTITILPEDSSFIVTFTNVAVTTVR